jgi:Uma2 family endonuclease
MATVPPEALGPFVSDLPSPDLVFPKADLLETDGEPLESAWHRAAINLLIESTQLSLRGRTDFYVGGNMFIYYSARQARTLQYRGPDYFFVKGVDGTRPRRYWLVYEEDGRYPDVITEVLSPSTAREDRTTKKTLYEQTFRTAEYFLYDPDTRVLEGWRHDGQRYQPIVPGENGRLWSEQLGLWLGTWEGMYQGQQGTWVRFFGAQSRLVPTPAEAAAQQAEMERQRAEAERQRAEAEHQRAEAAQQQAEMERQRAATLEAEVARLKSLLAEKGNSP